MKLQDLQEVKYVGKKPSRRRISQKIRKAILTQYPEWKPLRRLSVAFRPAPDYKTANVIIGLNVDYLSNDEKRILRKTGTLKTKSVSEKIGKIISSLLKYKIYSNGTTKDLSTNTQYQYISLDSPGYDRVGGFPIDMFES